MTLKTGNKRKTDKMGFIKMKNFNFKSALKILYQESEKTIYRMRKIYKSCI